MPLEIEYKYLVESDDWKSITPIKTLKMKQGYICADYTGKTVRVRTVDDGDGKLAYLTIKSPSKGITRSEYEYEIPYDEAVEMFALCESSLEKTRYVIPVGDDNWEVDVFECKNKGLVLAELEVESEEQVIKVPSWAGQNVSKDFRFANSSLSKRSVIN